MVFSFARYVESEALGSVQDEIPDSVGIAQNCIRRLDFLRNFSWLDRVLGKPSATLFFPFRIQFQAQSELLGGIRLQELEPQLASIFRLALKYRLHASLSHAF